MDLLVILIIALVLVLMWRGPKTLPKWGEALGRAFRGAKTEASKAQADLQARASGPTDPTDSSDDRPT
jgi:mttA/Hcf106 family.